MSILCQKEACETVKELREEVEYLTQRNTSLQKDVDRTMAMYREIDSKYHNALEGYDKLSESYRKHSCEMKQYMDNYNIDKILKVRLLRGEDKRYTSIAFKYDGTEYARNLIVKYINSDQCLSKIDDTTGVLDVKVYRNVGYTERKLIKSFEFEVYPNMWIIIDPPIPGLKTDDHNIHVFTDREFRNFYDYQRLPSLKDIQEYACLPMIEKE